METHFFPRETMQTLRTAFPRSHHASWAALAASMLLAACSSTPLPPWPVSTQPPSQTAPAPRPAAHAAPPSAEGPANVRVTPLANTAVQADSPLPYSPMVAARFPLPQVRYDTPGLASGRLHYTSNEELLQALQRLTQPAQAAASAQATSTRLMLLSLGSSQQGQPLHAVLATRAADAKPATLEASERPTVLLIGQQHGDAPATSEALLVVARELAPGGLLEPLLEHIHVLVVPRANPDGAMAQQHSTANGIDLAHDHLLLQTPEAQALATLVRDYRPSVVLDLGEYPALTPFTRQYQAIARHDLLVHDAQTANLPEFTTKAAHEWFEEPLHTALRTQYVSSDGYYNTTPPEGETRLLATDLDSGTWLNAQGLKNAVSLQVFSRGQGLGRAHLQRRVHSLVLASTSVLRSAAERSQRLEQVRSFVARDTSAQACKGSVAVRVAATAGRREWSVIDPLSGADRSLLLDAESVASPHIEHSQTRPCGYWLSAEAETAVQRLRLLGLQVLRIAEPGSVLADASSEEHNTPSAAARAAIDTPAGSYYLPLNQPWAALAVAALEPEAPGGFQASGLLGGAARSARVMAAPTLVFEEPD